MSLFRTAVFSCLAIMAAGSTISLAAVEDGKLGVLTTEARESAGDWARQPQLAAAPEPHQIGMASPTSAEQAETDQNTIVRRLILGLRAANAWIRSWVEWAIEAFEARPAGAADMSSSAHGSSLIADAGATKDKEEAQITAREAEAKAQHAKRKQELDRRIEEGLKKLEEFERQEKARKAEEARKADEARAALKARRLAEEKRVAELERAERERKAAEEKRAADFRKAALLKAEEERWAAQQQYAAEVAAAQRARELEEQQQAEEARKRAEAERIADEKRLAEQEELRRKAEAERKAEAQRLAEERRQAELLRAEETRKAEEQRQREVADKAEEQRADVASAASADEPKKLALAASVVKKEKKHAAGVVMSRSRARWTGGAPHTSKWSTAKRSKHGLNRKHSSRKVTARRKLKAQAPPSRRRGVYVVRRGDTLWAIAKRYYRNGARYTTLCRANRRIIRDPDFIYPGQVLRVPRA